MMIVWIEDLSEYHGALFAWKLSMVPDPMIVRVLELESNAYDTADPHEPETSRALDVYTPMNSRYNEVTTEAKAGRFFISTTEAVTQDECEENGRKSQEKNILLPKSKFYKKRFKVPKVERKCVVLPLPVLWEAETLWCSMS